jgi:hypothetical protein
MGEREEFWIPLVDEPIGSIVAQIQDENPDIEQLVETPHRLLAFKTFSYIRVGVLLGELLVDRDLSHDPAETWVDALLRDPEQKARVVTEVRAVAEEIARDPHYANEQPLGPDDEARERFREFARRQRS